jgi:hypothetical protein
MIPEILIGASLTAGGYQDWRTRQIYDYTWLPLCAGALLQIAFHPILLISFLIISGLSTLASFKGLMGIADIFALIALGLLPSFKMIILAFIFFTTLALLHVAIRTMLPYIVNRIKIKSVQGFPFVTYSAVAFVITVIVFQLNLVR